MPTLPTFQEEARYWQNGISLVAGLDEAGMGALAGPVVAGAVMFDTQIPPSLPLSGEEDYGILVIRYQNSAILDDPASVRSDHEKKIRTREVELPPPDKGDWGVIRDSKTLSPKQREQAAGWIKAKARTWAIGEASVEEITELNIRRAAHLAMRRAVDQLKAIPQLLLIDGTPAEPHPTIPATNIIKGDSVSFSIAAASILAKVHRDAIMIALDKTYPAYGFAKHKGYGAAVHLAALNEHGASPHHRATYAPVAKIIKQKARA